MAGDTHGGPVRGRLRTAAAAAIALALAGVGVAALLGRDGSEAGGTSAVGTTSTVVATTAPTTASAPDGTTPARTTAPRRPGPLPLATLGSGRCRFPYPRGWRVDRVDERSGSAYRSIVLAPASDARIVCEVDPTSAESAGSAAGRLRTQGSSAPDFDELAFRRGPRVRGGPSFRWDYVQRVGGTRVHTSQLFFGGGTLLVQAPTGVYDDLRPTVDAIVRRFAAR